MKKVLLCTLCLVLWGSFVHAQPPTPTLFEFDRREIDFGVLTPGKVAHASLTMVKVGSEQTEWVLEDPPDWRNAESRLLQGRLTGETETVVVALKYERVNGIKGEPAEKSGGPQASPASIQMVLLVGNESVKYARAVSFGTQQVQLRFKSGSALRPVTVKYEIPEQDAAVLNVEPSILDFGSAEAEKNQSGQFKITNRGVKQLHWKVAPSGQKDRGRVISFLSEESRGKGVYVPPRADPMLQLSGSWKEAEGYPSGGDPESPLIIDFTGSAAVLSVRKDINAGVLAVHLDDFLIGVFDCRSGRRGIFEMPVGEKLPEGVHRLTVKASRGDVVLTGIRIQGKDILSGPAGWIKVFPEAGDTTSETDYVNVRVHTDRLEPGFYAGTLLVRSNGGDVPVDISIRVNASSASRVMNVYKYTRGLDFLYTADPDREDRHVLSYYRKQGFAFRLFKDNTPGTKKLFRWYHPRKGDHFYSSDPDGGGARALYGYIFEGAIGNIATSKLPGTRELYCWYNASTGLHFYTLDLKGEGFAKKGYKFNSIVGYVR